MKLKGRLPVLCMFLLFQVSVQAQVNSYFTNDPVWQLSSMCAVSYPCIQNETYNYYLNGDTVFGSLVYKKLYRKGQGYYSWLAPYPPTFSCSGTYQYIDPDPIYFIRSAGKQMFIRDISDTTESLLYDFNLSVGDTLPVTFNNYANDVTVTAIDSVYTPYGYLKRFALSGTTWSQYLIEGIGHSKGLLEPMDIPLECGFDLMCYSLNDSAYYPVQGPACDIAVGVAGVSNRSSYSASPNPFNDHTIIHFSTGMNNAEMKIYDVHGKQVRHVLINAGKIVLQRGDLPAGVYFTRIFQDNRPASTGKLIITD